LPSRRVISREYLVSKEVYTPSAKRVGKVKDIGFIIDEEGRERVCLIVATIANTTVEIPVSKIRAMGDIIILAEEVEIPEQAEGMQSTPAPQQEAPRPMYEIPRCPTCNSALAYVPSNRKFYCFNCKKYVDLPPTVVAKIPKCPQCGNPLSYIEQYSKWYCYNCRKYVEI